MAPQLFDPITIGNQEYEAIINIALAKENNGTTIPGLIVYDLSARKRRPNEEQNQVQKTKALLSTKPYQTIGSQIMMEHRLDMATKVAKNAVFSVGFFGGSILAELGLGALGTGAMATTAASTASAAVTTAETGATVTVLGAGAATTKITSLAASVLLYFKAQSEHEERKRN